jgi:hypothetical protein
MGINRFYTNWINGYELRFGSGSRLIGLDSHLTGRIRLRETGAHPLGWPGRSAACWVIRGPCTSKGELGHWLSPRLTRGYKNPFFIFEPFQYLLPKYDSNLNSNFE